MNLQSDNNNQAQTNSAFSRLKAASKSVLQTMDTPQRATMAYPIPKEQWEAFQEYMQAVMMFQPELYAELSKMATLDQMHQMMYMNYVSHQEWMEEWTKTLGRDMKNSVDSISPRLQYLLTENKETLSQDGKKREEFLKKLSATTDEKVSALTKLISDMKWWIIGTMFSSVLLSALVSAIICLLTT